jgi:hypothetical protein
LNRGKRGKIRNNDALNQSDSSGVRPLIVADVLPMRKVSKQAVVEKCDFANAFGFKRGLENLIG